MALINLLPMELRQDLPIEKNKVLPKLIFLGLILLILIIYFTFYFVNYKMQLDISRIDMQLMDLQPKTKQAQQLKCEISNFKEQVSALKSLQGKKTSWNLLLWDINNCIPQDLWLISFITDKEHNITLNGQSLDFNSIGVFLNQLSNLPSLLDIHLLWAETVTIDEQIVYNFEVQATLDEGRED